MPQPPLTHHDILGLVEPFTRRGRQVDLAASDRIERKLVFKSVDLPGERPGVPGLRETLELECRGSDNFRLTRLLACADGRQATLQASGTRPEALLLQVDAVAPAQHFRSGAGYAIARSYTVPSADDKPRHDPSAAPPLILCRGVVSVEGLTLTLSVIEVRGAAGDITLDAAPGETLALPEDLLAVQGWDWSRLASNESGWTGRLRLRGKGPRRTRTAERALEQVAMHLARVMAEPPAAFHQRHVGARWGVVFRRGIPSLTAVGLIGGTLLLTRGSSGSPNAGLFLALHYVPIAVLALSFSLQEMARFEIPPLPRRSKAMSWRLLPPEAAAGEPTAAGLGSR